MIGTAVDRYEILEELGHGGMSVVYRGLDGSLEREVAVKVLHNHLAKNLENRRRFHREAKAIARLRHPNILEIYDFSSEDADRSYIVMEYIAGENLRQFVARTSHPPPEVAALLGIEICNALQHAHDHGIIHRDLKPENVMVSSAGEVKLMDFGIAHVIDAETMTATGSLMGSPAHMAPELIDGEKVDVRADVFSLGTVLYWLATGVLPFDGANAPQVLKRVLAGDYDDIELVAPKVGKRLGRIIECCLSHSPADRYGDVVAVRKQLEAFVGAMGFGDVEKELRRYLLDPDQFRREYDDVIVNRLTSLARQAQRERNVPEAIALFNRILAYQPDNRDVKRMLDGLCRQDRLRRFGPPVVLVAVLAMVVGVWIAIRPPPPPPAPPPPDPVALVASQSTARGVVTDSLAKGTDEARIEAQLAEEAKLAPVARAFASAGRLVYTSLVVAHNEQRRRPLTLVATPLPAKIAESPASADVGVPDVGAAAVVTYPWKIKVLPPAALLTIDGEAVDVIEADSGIELAAGRHLIQARGQGLRSASRRLNVTGPGEETLVLDYEPGRLAVSSNVNAVVWIDDAKHPSPIGRGKTFTLPFGSAASTPGLKEITLRAADARNMTAQQQQVVEVRAGQTERVSFTFESKPP